MFIEREPSRTVVGIVSSKSINSDKFDFDIVFYNIGLLTGILDRRDTRADGMVGIVGFNVPIDTL